MIGTSASFPKALTFKFRLESFCEFYVGGFESFELILVQCLKAELCHIFLKSAKFIIHYLSCNSTATFPTH